MDGGRPDRLDEINRAANARYYRAMLEQTLRLYDPQARCAPLPEVAINDKPHAAGNSSYQNSNREDGEDSSEYSDEDMDVDSEEDSDEDIDVPTHSQSAFPAPSFSARTSGRGSMDTMQVPCLSADTDALVAGDETGQSAVSLPGLPAVTAVAGSRRPEALRFGRQVVQNAYAAVYNSSWLAGPRQQLEQQLDQLDVLPRLQRLGWATRDLLDRVQAARAARIARQLRASSPAARTPPAPGHRLHDTAAAVLQQAAAVAAEARCFLAGNLATMVATAVATGSVDVPLPGWEAMAGTARLERQLQTQLVTMRSGRADSDSGSADTVFVDRLDDEDEPVFLDREENWELL